MFVVTVDFRIDPDQMTAFLPLMRENAALSLNLEPECRRFDVCTSREDRELVFLYEVYETETAFQQHLGMAHFKRFDAATAEMVRSKSVTTYHLLPQAEVSNGPD